MREPGASGFAEALGRARQAFADSPVWRRIQANGMARPFGWAASAARYVEVYERAIAVSR
jgi:starch synthase